MRPVAWIVVAAALVSSSACSRLTPGVLYASNRPLVQPYEMQTPQRVEACEWFFLSLPVTRPFAQGYALRELVDRVKGKADAVVDVTVDARISDWLVVRRSCWQVSGTPVRIVETTAPGVPAPRSTAQPAAQAEPRRQPAPDEPDMSVRRVAGVSVVDQRPVRTPGVSGSHTCLVEVWIDGEGHVLHVVPSEDRCDPKVADPVVASVARWRFESVSIDGAPVPVRFPLRVRTGE